MLTHFSGFYVFLCCLAVVDLVPTISSITVATNSTPTISSITVATNSTPTISSTTVTTNSTPTISSTKVTTNSTPISLSTTVTTNSTPISLSTKVTTNSTPISLSTTVTSRMTTRSSAKNISRDENQDSCNGESCTGAALPLAVIVSFMAGMMLAYTPLIILKLREQRLWCFQERDAQVKNKQEVASTKVTDKVLREDTLERLNKIENQTDDATKPNQNNEDIASASMVNEEVQKKTESDLDLLNNIEQQSASFVNPFCSDNDKSNEKISKEVIQMEKVDDDEGGSARSDKNASGADDNAVDIEEKNTSNEIEKDEDKDADMKKATETNGKQWVKSPLRESNVETYEHRRENTASYLDSSDTPGYVTLESENFRISAFTGIPTVSSADTATEL